MKKLYLVLMVFFLGVGITVAQRVVTGNVTDASGVPVIGANIVVQGTTVGTISDIDGNYSLNVPDSAENLVISFTGYTTQILLINGRSVINVQISEGEVLNEVVVTALGISRDEKSIGYAVQQVSSETIANTNTVSAIDALAGSVAGVQVTSSSGAAGGSSRIVLRGQTSFNGNNQALLVVDGIRISNDENHSERSLGGVNNSNRGIDINPNDIANISVLKGAAATALYGIEGSRGVILITTKKGADGSKMKVDFNTNVTIANVTNVTPLQDQFLQGSNGVWQGPETGQSGSWGPSVENAYWDGSDYKFDKNGKIVISENGAPAGATKFTPYNNVEDFFQTGYTYNNNLSLSGGAKTSNYRFSIGSSNSNGVTPNNTFGRYNLGLNVGSSAFDEKLTLGFSANYVKSGGVRIQQGSNISGVMLGLLRTPISFDNSNGLDNPTDDPTSYIFSDNRQRNYRGGGGYDNPFWVVNNNPFNDNVNRFYGNIEAKYAFSKWFKLGALVGTDLYTDNRVQRFEIGSRANPSGRVIEDNYNYRHVDSYYNLSGGGNLIDKLSFNYLLGVNTYTQSLKNNFTTGDGLNFFGFPKLGNSSTINTAVSNTNIKTAGAFGTLDFGYNNFLYLTLTGRNDWSSTLINPFAEFKASDISFFYPSASLGFVFSELFNSKALDFGKLRLSYAEVGGGAPGAYSTSTPFILPVQNAGTINDVNDGWTNGLGFPFQGVSGFVLNGVAGNPFLKPSRTIDIETGLDLRFLNNRVGIDLTYYTRESVDQIIAINIPYSTGFQRAVVNSGSLATVGGEVILTLAPIVKKDFQWNIMANWSKWRTTVESLPEGVQSQYLDGFTGSGVFNIAPEKDANGNITKKYEYGQIFGNPFQRVNTTDGKFDASLPYNPDGALIIDDNPTSSTYGFPIADPTSRVIGNPNPDFLLGITNSFAYKNLSFSFLFDIKQGGDIWNGTKGALTFFGMSELTENRGTVSVFEGVKATEGGANDIAVEVGQSWYQGNGGGFGNVAEHFIEDGSFRRLRYATLGYDLGSIASKYGISGLKITVTGRNLYLNTPYTGYDPELSLVGSGSNGQGLDYFQLPNTRSYAFGLNLTF